MQSMSDSTSSRAVQAFQVRSATSKSIAYLWFSRFIRSNQFPGYSITRKRLFRLRIPSLFEISLKALASFENLRPVKELHCIITFVRLRLKKIILADDLSTGLCARRAGPD